MLAHHCHRRGVIASEGGPRARDDVAPGHRARRSVDSVRRTDTEAENREGQRGGGKVGRKRRRGGGGGEEGDEMRWGGMVW